MNAAFVQHVAERKTTMSLNISSFLILYLNDLHIYVHSGKSPVYEMSWKTKVIIIKKGSFRFSSSLIVSIVS